jgi:hypothetical protein
MLKQARSVVYLRDAQSLLTSVQPRKHAQVTESSVPSSVELAEADIEEAKEEWKDLVLSDED